MHKSALLQNCQCIPIIASLSFQTLVGKATSTKAILLNQICIPEFNSNISIYSHNTYLFDQNCHYSIILGADFLDKFGFTINYADHIIMWIDLSIPLKDPHKLFCPEMLNDLNNQLSHKKFKTGQYKTPITALSVWLLMDKK